MKRDMRKLSSLMLFVMASTIRGGGDTPYNSMSCTYSAFVANSEVPQCSKVGKMLLEEAGNAMDAAIATTLCIGVINSFSSGIGGGGFLMVYQRERGGAGVGQETDSKEREHVDFLDFRETAPEKTALEAYRNNPKASQEGGLAVGTPSEIMGLFVAHSKYGRLPWKRLFDEPIAIAKSFKVTKLLAAKLQANRKHILRDPGLRKIYSRGGKLLQTGDTVARNNYAMTLKAIADNPLTMHEGAVARRMVKAVQLKGGVLSLADLKRYKVARRDILTGHFRGHRVYTTSLPTSGVLVIEALNMLEKINFDRLRQLQQDEMTYQFHRLIIHILRLIGVRRGELGDPDFLSNSSSLVRGLLSVANTRKNIKALKAASKGERKAVKETVPFMSDHGTTHLEVVDGDGMIVQVTSTINLEFGAKFMDPVTGIIFNNQMDDFYITTNINGTVPDAAPDSDAGLPSLQGNIMAKNKRPLSSTAPVLIVGGGDVIIIGATGGARIPSAIIGTIAHLLLGEGLSEAVSSVRVHNQLSPSDITYVEEFFPADTKNRLENEGTRVETSELNSIYTSVQAVHISKYGIKGQKICAVADARKNGLPAGR